jgi:hypothetical protein
VLPMRMLSGVIRPVGIAMTAWIIEGRGSERGESKTGRCLRIRCYFAIAVSIPILRHVSLLIAHPSDKLQVNDRRI